MHALYDEWSKLAAVLGERCVAQRRVIAGAESCTGGLIAAVLTSVSGSSAWFDRAHITYSNQAKVDLLGVGTATLATHGAVSEETAREMAVGALAGMLATPCGPAAAAANLSYAVTGVAGPTGGSTSKPVGMVCFAFASAVAGHMQVASCTRQFRGDRNAIREQSVNLVLAELTRMASAAEAAD